MNYNKKNENKEPRGFVAFAAFICCIMLIVIFAIVYGIVFQLNNLVSQ